LQVVHRIRKRRSTHKYPFGVVCFVFFSVHNKPKNKSSLN
jgi:hypothetical protein